MDKLLIIQNRGGADPDEWDEQTMLNLAAPMRLTRHLVPEMVRRPAHARASGCYQHVVSLQVFIIG